MGVGVARDVAEASSLFELIAEFFWGRPVDADWKSALRLRLVCGEFVSQQGVRSTKSRGRRWRGRCGGSGVNSALPPSLARLGFWGWGFETQIHGGY
jgi:hypothetical protein